MPRTKLSTKGQVILPKSVREKTRWRPGQAFDVEVRPDGVLLKPIASPKTHKLADIVGILRHDGPPISLEEMDEAIARGATERYKRSFL